MDPHSKKLGLEEEEEAPSSRRHDIRPETTDDALARVGQMLTSKYRLDAIIGSGAMGHVYRATNTLIGRTVAIKLLRREHATNQNVVERFLREARTANLVQHPNIVDVIDVGTTEDGVPFLVAELLEGETLLAYAERSGGKIPIAELIEILGPVLSAVAEAHDRSIVHRDLKPENVFLAGKRRRRVPKVLDFGISKVRGLEGELTMAGVMMGTPAYMAPELAVSSKDADARTDVWALGVIVFEMLTGQLPFEGDSVVAVLRAVATEDAKKLSDVAPAVPASVSRVVAKCLSREPAARYPNAKALALDLAAAFEEAAPVAVAQWSLRPGVSASEPPPGMPDMPKPPKLPGTEATVVDVHMPASAPKPATTTLIMDERPDPISGGPKTPVDEAAKRAMASPANASAPVMATMASASAKSPSATVGGAKPRADASVAKDPRTSTAKTARHKAARRRGPSTRALVIFGALIVIVLAEVVILLKLAG